MLEAGPVATRSEVLELLGSEAEPMHAREIARRLRVSDVDYLGLQRLLVDLSFEGVLARRPGQGGFKIAPRSAQARGAEREGLLTVHPRRLRLRGEPRRRRGRRVRPAGGVGRRDARRPREGASALARGARTRGRGHPDPRARAQARRRDAAAQGQERVARAGRHARARAHRPAARHRRGRPRGQQRQRRRRRRRRDHALAGDAGREPRGRDRDGARAAGGALGRGREDPRAPGNRGGAQPRGGARGPRPTASRCRSP